MNYQEYIKSDEFQAYCKSPWGKAFIGYFVVMGLVGALTPSDILTAYNGTRAFTDFMASIVPQIDTVTALGIDPDINRFYFSVMWAGNPYIVLIYVLGTWFDRKKYFSDPRGFYRLTFLKSLRLLLICLGFALLCYHVEWVTTSRTRLTLSSFGTSLGRFAMPQVFVLGTVVCSLVVLTWLIGWFTGFIPRNIRKQNELEKTHGK